MAVNAGAVTAEQLRTMPDDGMRRELVRGEVRVTTPAGFEHGRIAYRLAGLLFAHVESAGGGTGTGAETGFLLARDPDTVRAPDAAFVSEKRLKEVGPTHKFWPGAPDFAAEVVSPDDSFREVEGKALAWLSAGTKLVLVVDPARQTATVYRDRGQARVHTAEDTLDLGAAVPGWHLKLAELFA